MLNPEDPPYYPAPLAAIFFDFDGTINFPPEFDDEKIEANEEYYYDGKTYQDNTLRNSVCMTNVDLLQFAVKIFAKNHFKIFIATQRLINDTLEQEHVREAIYKALDILFSPDREVFRKEDATPILDYLNNKPAEKAKLDRSRSKTCLIRGAQDAGLMDSITPDRTLLIDDGKDLGDKWLKNTEGQPTGRQFICAQPSADTREKKCRILLEAMLMLIPIEKLLKDIQQEEDVTIDTKQDMLNYLHNYCANESNSEQILTWQNNERMRSASKPITQEQFNNLPTRVRHRGSSSSVGPAASFERPTTVIPSPQPNTLSLAANSFSADASKFTVFPAPANKTLIAKPLPCSLSSDPRFT